MAKRLSDHNSRVRNAASASKHAWAWHLRILTLCLSLVVGLLLSEAVLHRLLPDPNKYYVWPPHLRAELRPSPAATPGIIGPSRFTVNSLGIRGRELSRDERREYRILAIGGSTTECLFLDDTKAWPFLLQEMLRQTSAGRDVWVGNVGKSGANSRDHVVQVKYLLPQYPRIDVVMMLVGINDLNWRLRYGGDRLQLPMTDPVAQENQLPRAFAIVPAVGPRYKRTALYGLLRQMGARIEGVQTRREAWQQDPTAQFYELHRAERRARVATLDTLPDLTAGLPEYRANLEDIVDLVQAQGARIVLMTQPVLWRDDLDPAEEQLLWNGWSNQNKAYYSPRALAEGMALYNQQLLHVCQSRGIECIDLASQVPRTAEMFYDDAHYTEKGAQRVARVVNEYFAKRKPFLQSGTEGMNGELSGNIRDDPGSVSVSDRYAQQLDHSPYERRVRRMVRLPTAVGG